MAVAVLRVTGHDLGSSVVELSFREQSQSAEHIDLTVDSTHLSDMRWLLEESLTTFGQWQLSGRYSRSYEGFSSVGGQLYGALSATEAMRSLMQTVLSDPEPPPLVIEAESDQVFILPWEYLRSDQGFWLWQRLGGIWRRRLNMPAAGVRAPRSAGALRVLLVVSRPSAEADVSYRLIARAVMGSLEQVGAEVELLRPGTFSALEERLNTDPGYFDLVHYDGHGVDGGLAFEDGPVEAHRLTAGLATAQVPIFVLNACRSGNVSEEAPLDDSEPVSVAHALLASGASSVVTMSAKVRVGAARCFMERFYRELASGSPVSRACRQGRSALNSASAEAGVGKFDWGIPVLYQVEDGSLVEAVSEAEQLPSAVSPLAVLQEELEAPASPEPADDPFVGRDGDLFRLDRALDEHGIVLVHGVAGIGKTTLVERFLSWRKETGGAAEVVFFTFRGSTPVASIVSCLEQVLRAKGPRNMADDLGSQMWLSAPPEKRLQALRRVLPGFVWILVLDDFETFTGYPGPEDSAYDQQDQQGLLSFLRAATKGRFKVVLTSRRPEDAYLSTLPVRLALRGLERSATAAAFTQYAHRFGSHGRLKKALKDEAGEQEFSELLNLLDGHPLATRVAAYRLRESDLKQVLESFRGSREQVSIPQAEASYRSISLEAMLDSMLERLSTEKKQALALLGLFEGTFAEQRFLDLFSHDKFPENVLADRSKGFLRQVLADGAELGLVERAENPKILRVIPGCQEALRAVWDQEVSDADRVALEKHLCRFWAAMCRLYRTQAFEKGDMAREAIVFVLTEEGKIRRALELCGKHDLWDAAEQLLRLVLRVLEMIGRVKDVDHLIGRWLENVSDSKGSPKDSQNEDMVGIWRFLMGGLADRAMAYGSLDQAEAVHRSIIEALEKIDDPDKTTLSNLAVGYHQLGMVEEKRGNLDAAEKWYHKSLEIEEQLGNRPGMAGSYHQLGMVEEKRGNLDAAEKWYHKSLEIKEQLGDRPGMATSYHQLGMVEEKRGNLDAAEKWYRKSLEILEQLGDRPGMATSYHQLGMVEQDRGNLDAAEKWYRKSLEIKEQLGDRPGMATSYHQLGMVEQDRGNLDAAEKWYHKSLEIKEQLGNRPGMATSLSQIGLLLHQKGDTKEGLKLELESLFIRSELQLPEVAISVGILRKMYREAENDKFVEFWKYVTETDELPDWLTKEDKEKNKER